jgi:hypothetical protein
MNIAVYAFRYQGFIHTGTNVLPGMLDTTKAMPTGLWGRIPLEWLPRLHGNTLKVMVVLSCCADAAGEAWPSIPLICQYTGLSQSRVYVALSAAESTGAIARRSENRQTVYSVFPEMRNRDSRKCGIEIPGNAESRFPYFRVSSLEEKKKEKNIEKSAAAPPPIYPGDLGALYPGSGMPEDNQVIGAPADLTDQEEQAMKFTNVRRGESAEVVSERKQRAVSQRGVIEALAKHLTQFTREDHRKYLLPAQTSTWSSLLALYSYDELVEIINEAMSPANRPRLESNPKFSLGANSIAFFLSYVRKPGPSAEELAAKQEIQSWYDNLPVVHYDDQGKPISA